MQTAKKNTAKKTAIVNVTIDSITKRLSNITGTQTKSRDSIYNYPNDFTAIDISAKKGKSFRVKMRNKFEQFVNAFTMLNKQKEIKQITLNEFTNSVKEIKTLFAEFYKEYYRVNDYSFTSVSQSNNEDKKTEINAFLSFCKDQQGAKKITPTKAAKTAKKTTVKTASKKKDAKKETITPVIAEIKA